MCTVITYNQYQHYRVSVPFTLGNVAAHVSSLAPAHTILSFVILQPPLPFESNPLGYLNKGI